ncbi:hypothetical protein EVG20_g9968 [Dentipellis fragilis]|uniref:Uncharacterized protein n=1 Tax=Dentipellis fragilis TaxID=205917 RepID=A0A4Y9XWJ0_9AGAM|nr:hypothetical protein EVG20_g9968 [Dentipellis fragilis]
MAQYTSVPYNPSMQHISPHASPASRPPPYSYSPSPSPLSSPNASTTSLISRSPGSGSPMGSGTGMSPHRRPPQDVRPALAHGPPMLRPSKSVRALPASPIPHMRDRGDDCGCGYGSPSAGGEPRVVNAV